MQYEIAGVPGTLDLPLFMQLMTDVDPAAVIDLAPGTRTLRMSTILGTHTVLEVLARIGVDTARTAIDLLPSQCCGGCGG